MSPLLRWLAALAGMTGWLILAWLVYVVARGGPLYMPFGLWELVGDIVTIALALSLTGWLAATEWKEL